MADPRALRINEVLYDLPADRIALHPLADRDSSKLLLWRNGSITDHTFRDIPELLPTGSMVLLNDTRVVNARLMFRKGSGAVIEVFCLEPAAGGPVDDVLRSRGEAVWVCSIGNARRWKGDPLERTFQTPDGEVRLTAERLSDSVHDASVRFVWTPSGLSFAEVLAHAGEVPLPPYLKRVAVHADGQRYQTVFAQAEGSVAAPTAGLHFTPALLNRMKDRGIDRAFVTLHVGAGTFQPVHAETMAGHAMHTERILVSRGTMIALHDAIGRRPLVATGTTTLRTLESLYWHGASLLRGADPDELNVAQWEPYDRVHARQPGAPEAMEAVLRWMERRGYDQVTGHTALIIAPGYRIRTVDALITNFHQPGSTLLLLLAAVVGPQWRRIYDHALANGYRFLSYGDGSLLHLRQ